MAALTHRLAAHTLCMNGMLTFPVPPAAQASLPELPHQRRARYVALGLSMYDVLVLSDDVGIATYFDAVLAAGAPAKPAANWVMGDIMAHCKVGRPCGMPRALPSWMPSIAAPDPLLLLPPPHEDCRRRRWRWTSSP